MGEIYQSLGAVCSVGARVAWVSSLTFEYAYALYKTNAFAKALTVVNRYRRRSPEADEYQFVPVSGADDARFALLEAQVVSRSGEAS